MRLSTALVSTAFVLTGMSAAFSVEREKMLVARFADFDFFGEVEARAYNEEPELYSQGGAISINNHKSFSYAPHHRRAFCDPLRSEIIRRHNLPWEEDFTQTETHSPVRLASKPRRRRSFYEPSRIEIARRHDPPMHPEFVKEYRKMFRDRNATRTRHHG